VYGRDYCQNRLQRTLRRAVDEAERTAGKGLQLAFLTRAEWLEQQAVVAA